MKAHSFIIVATTLAISAFSMGVMQAEVHVNPLFSDGAVLQRGQPLPVWGTANEGEKVTVELAGQKHTTIAKDGNWRVIFDPLTAGGPFTMTITGDHTVTLNNLMIGEVWICSGQSNMEFGFARTATAKEETLKADLPKIRMFTVKKKISIKPQTTVEGTWVECSPQSVGGFSAVGYFFAREIHQKLGVAVGMIHTSWGGTPAQAWTSNDGFGSDPALNEYVEATKRNLDNYPAAVAAYPAKVEAFNVAKKAWSERVATQMQAWNEATAKAKQDGQPLPPKPIPDKAPAPPAGPDGTQGQPTTLFHGMLEPIIPYAIKGVIWYQGEANARNARQYRTLFPAMIADWRAKWNQGDFPFCFVQIAPFNGQPPEIREAQMLTLARSKNTAMAVTTDVGNATNIHPTQKEPVGQRLALAARALAYQEKIEYSGPLYQEMTISGDKATLSFTHANNGLVAKGGELKGFTIAGADGKFVPAKAEIDGSHLIVSAADVPAPKAVRFGWANTPDVNLFNQQGLPASPFRTDVD